MTKVQVLGLCRFSYPAPVQSFQVKHADLAERRAALYDPARLNQRLMWLEHVFLPPLRGQTDQDFTILFLLGEDFPEPFRSRIETLIADVPQIIPVWRPTQDLRTLTRELFLAACDPEADLVAEFNADDDDAFALDYVEELRRHAPLMAPLVQRCGKAALDFQRGILMETDSEGVFSEAITVPLWATAMAVYMRPDHRSCMLDFKHHRLYGAMPVLSFSDRFMFVRGAHDTNDSKVNQQRVISRNLEAAEIETELKERFDIDQNAFADAWNELCSMPGARLKLAQPRKSWRERG